MDSGSRQRNSGVPEFRQCIVGASRKHPTCARGSAGMTAACNSIWSGDIMDTVTRSVAKPLPIQEVDVYTDTRDLLAHARRSALKRA